MADPGECNLCLEAFDEGPRCPRILPCSHHYCTMCIDGLITNKMKQCPVCREKFKAKAGKDLMKNRGVLDFISYVTESSSSKKGGSSSTGKRKSNSDDTQPSKRKKGNNVNQTDGTIASTSNNYQREYFNIQSRSSDNYEGDYNTGIGARPINNSGSWGGDQNNTGHGELGDDEAWQSYEYDEWANAEGHSRNNEWHAQRYDEWMPRGVGMGDGNNDDWVDHRPNEGVDEWNNANTRIVDEWQYTHDLLIAEGCNDSESENEDTYLLQNRTISGERISSDEDGYPMNPYGHERDYSWNDDNDHYSRNPSASNYNECDDHYSRSPSGSEYEHNRSDDTVRSIRRDQRSRSHSGSEYEHSRNDDSDHTVGSAQHSRSPSWSDYERSRRDDSDHTVGNAQRSRSPSGSERSGSDDSIRTVVSDRYPRSLSGSERSGSDNSVRTLGSARPRSLSRSEDGYSESDDSVRALRSARPRSLSRSEDGYSGSDDSVRALGSARPRSLSGSEYDQSGNDTDNSRNNAGEGNSFDENTDSYYSVSDTSHNYDDNNDRESCNEEDEGTSDSDDSVDSSY